MQQKVCQCVCLYVRVCVLGTTNQLLMQMTCCCPTSARRLSCRIRAAHTPASNTHIHTLSPSRTRSPWPGSPARQRRTHPGFQDPQPAETVDLIAPYFVDMGDMGDPPKSKKTSPGCGPRRSDWIQLNFGGNYMFDVPGWKQVDSAYYTLRITLTHWQRFWARADDRDSTFWYALRIKS